MPFVELNKKQVRSLIDDYINEEMTTEQFEKFILDNIVYFSTWDNADMTKIIQKATKLQRKKQSDEEY